MQDKPVEILLIEENPVDIERIKTGFENARISNYITVIPNGEEAVNFIDMGVIAPELIILDIHQSKGDGFDILKKIRQSENCKKTPIVILTPSGTKADAIKAYQQYANSYINKPANCKKYLQIVKSIESFWLTSVN